MANLEAEIAAKILAASGLSVATLGLRFDKVVVRLLGRLRAFVEAEGPAGVTFVVTITAPIRRPAKTADDIERAIREGGPAEQSLELQGNAVRIRRLSHGGDAAPKVIGFVHNRGTDSSVLLAAAEAWLRPQSRGG